MRQPKSGLLDDIVAAAPNLHSAGSLSPVVLRAIARHLTGIDLQRSVETGSGASTLLLSHLSAHHTVFALDDGSGSITRVKSSLLFNSSTTHFVEGPTQITLPGHVFEHPLQLALLDGPHAFPFPALEYYYTYPHLAEGALLILDDIHIPSVHDLFRFLKADAMFDLLETVDRTAFFRRTPATVFPPTGDNWWRQGYNQGLLLRFVWWERLKSATPAALKNPLKRSSRGLKGLALSAAAGKRLSVEIQTPQDGSTVGDATNIQGTATIPAGTWLWLLGRRQDAEGWWPQGGAAVHIETSQWRQPCVFGSASDAGSLFELAAVVVDQTTHHMLERWVSEGLRTGNYAPVRLPDSVLSPALRTVRRGP